MVTLMEQLILVDRNDKVLGYGEKMECHSIPTKLHSLLRLTSKHFARNSITCIWSRIGNRNYVLPTSPL